MRLIGGAGNDTLDASGGGNAKLSDTEGQNRAVDAKVDDGEYTPAPAAQERPLDPAPRLDARELGSARGSPTAATSGSSSATASTRRSTASARHPYSNGAPGCGPAGRSAREAAGPTTPASSTARTATRSSASTPTCPASRCFASTDSATRPPPNRGPGLQQGQRQPVPALSDVQDPLRRPRPCSPSDPRSSTPRATRARTSSSTRPSRTASASSASSRSTACCPGTAATTPSSRGRACSRPRAPRTSRRPGT